MILVRSAVLILLFASTYGFQLGVRYVYNCTIEITSGNGILKEPNKNKNVSYRQLAQIHFTPVWQSSLDEEELLKVEMVNPSQQIFRGTMFQNRPPFTESYHSSLMYIHSVKGQIKRTFCDANVKVALKNILKGISSIIRYQILEPGFSEDSFCNVTYLSTEEQLKKITKDCRQPVDLKRKVHYVQNGQVFKTSQVEYYLNSDSSNIFREVNARECVEMYSALWRNGSVAVQANTYINLEAVFFGNQTVKADDVFTAVQFLEKSNEVFFVEEANLLEPVLGQSQESICDAQKLIKTYRNNLKSENLAKLTSVSAFAKLLECFRTATKTEINRVLNNKEFADILAGVLDVVAFTGTKAALDAAFEALDFIKGNSILLERYLLALSMVIHPTKGMINAVLNVLRKIEEYAKIKADDKMKRKFLADDKVVASLVTTLGALAKKLRQIDGDLNYEVLNAVENYLLRAIDGCDTESCVLLYLRGLRNAVLPNAATLLQELTMKGGRITYEALLALKSIGFQDSLQCEKLCMKIFYQLGMKHDTSSRILAAEMILQCYSTKDTLKYLLIDLENQGDYEMSTYISFKVTEKMQENPKFRSDVLYVLKEVRHYYSFAQKGFSVSFINPVLSFLSTTSEVNATYGVQVQMTSAGVTKRSSVDINMHSPGGSFHILSVGLFTEGLGNFISGSNEDDGDATPSSTLDLTLSGVALRPRILFSGIGDLMSLVLGGSGSEPSVAFQGTYHIMDVSEILVLENGLHVELLMEGIISDVLSGSCEISLWNRNSKSEISNDLAIMVKGSAAVKTDFAVVEDKYLLTGEFQLNIFSDVDFYEQPYELCAQMMHPEFNLTAKKESSMILSGHQVWRKKIQKKKWNFPAKSYLLHRKNNEMCASLYKKGY